MSNYTPEQIERVASDLEDLVGVVRAATAVEILRDVAATLRQQAGRADGKVIAAANACADRLQHLCETRLRGLECAEARECYQEMRAALTAALAQNTQGDGEPVAWLIEWNDPTYRGPRSVSFDKCAPDSGKCLPLYLHAERARVPAVDGVRLVAWMIDNREGCYVTEEGLQGWLAEFLREEAAAPSQRAEDGSRQCTATVEDKGYPSNPHRCSRAAAPGSQYCTQHHRTYSSQRAAMTSVRALSFFRSVIQSGEQWTSHCDAVYEQAMAHLSQPAQAVDVGAIEPVIRELRKWPKEETFYDHRATRLECADKLTRALSGEKAGPVGDGWQPIETAPKDGTDFLCYQRGDTYGIGYWHRSHRYPRAVDSVGDRFDPDYWMPLPASPTPDKEGEP